MGSKNYPFKINGHTHGYFVAVRYHIPPTQQNFTTRLSCEPVINGECHGISKLKSGKGHDTEYYDSPDVDMITSQPESDSSAE
jgi:hypothetical protein